MSRYRLSVVCQSTNNDALGRLHDVLIFLGKVAGPAGLGTARGEQIMLHQQTLSHDVPGG